MSWKPAVGLALSIFGIILALAPLLTQDRQELAAKINDPTLKAAAAVKGATDQKRLVESSSGKLSW
jgi:hypothetical protein